MSLFSAACAALACAVVFLVCRRLGTGRLAALTAALCLAFGPSFWGEANVQRVYALNALFLAAATLLACDWWRRRDVARFVLTLFVAALGAGNHTYMGVFAAVFGLVALLADPAFVLRPRVLALAALAGIAGLLPYAYLPLAARFEPPLLWGDPGSAAGLLDIVLRRDFWDRAWVQGPSDAVAVAVDYGAGLLRELTWAGALLAAVGVVAGWRRPRVPLALLLAAMLANLAVMALHGSRSDLFIWHRYYIPSYLMAALLVGLGADALLRRAPLLLRALPLAVPLVLLVTGWREFDRSRFEIAEDFARQALREVPPGGMLQAADDNVLFPLLYMTLVEGHRADVPVAVHGSLPLPAAAGFDPQATPLSFTHEPTLADPGLVAVPVGLTWRVWTRGRPMPPVAMPADELRGASDASVPKDFLTRSLIGHFHFMQAVTFAPLDWTRSLDHLARAAAAAPDDDVLFTNLGVLYLRNGYFDEALAALERAARIDPRRAGELPATVRAERDRLAALEAELGGGSHERLAELLAARGEGLAARGHRLRAGVRP